MKFSKYFYSKLICIFVFLSLQKPLFKSKKLVRNTTQQSVIYVYFFIKCVVRWSENSVRFEKSYGNWLPDGSNSVRFYLRVRYGMYGQQADLNRTWSETPNIGFLVTWLVI